MELELAAGVGACVKAREAAEHKIRESLPGWLTDAVAQAVRNAPTAHCQPCCSPPAQGRAGRATASP